ncbi:hypothetical protein RJZ56_000682 [Blastomyces dermatitidis]
MSLPPPSDPAAAAAAAAAEAAFHSFSTEAWTLLAVAILVTGIRTYARVTAVGFKGLQPDDYLVLVGATFYTIETALAYSVGNVAKGLANNGMTDEQRAALSPGSPEHRLRLQNPDMRVDVLWDIAMVAQSVAAGALHEIDDVCQPAISNQIIWVFLGLNVTTDMYLLSIPIPMLWQSSIKPLKKVGLTILFSGGLLVMACAVLRVVMIVIDPVNGAQSAGSWAVRETFVAVVTTNLPMIFPLMKRWLSSVFGSLITSMRSSKRTGNETPKDLRTFGGSSGFNSSNRRGRGPPTANPIPNTTFSESEERIIEEYNMQEMKNNKNRSTNGNADSTQRYNGNDNKIQKRIDFTVVSEDGSSDGQRASPGNHDNGRLHNGFDFSGGAATSGFRTGDRANTRNF